MFVILPFVLLFCFNSSWSINLSDGPIISDESLFDSINFKSKSGFFSDREHEWSGWMVGEDRVDGVGI
jgi:hypothetical protein